MRPQPAAPPLSCTEDKALTFPPRPLRPSSSARPSYSVRSSGVSYSFPPRSLIGAGAPDRARPLAPKARPILRSCLTPRWATSRSPWLDTCRLRRLTHAHLRTRLRALGVVLADGARVRHRVCSCVDFLGHYYIRHLFFSYMALNVSDMWRISMTGFARNHVIGSVASHDLASRRPRHATLF